MSTTLARDATWDDQGLWFTLIFNSVVIAALTTLSFSLLKAPVLWIRRLYRTNHTLLVPASSSESPPSSPRLQQTPRTTQTTKEQQRGDSRGKEETSSPASPRSSPRGFPKLRQTGRALPYECSLFAIPSWRSWTNVEEDIPHLVSIFAANMTPSAGDAAHVGMEGENANHDETLANSRNSNFSDMENTISTGTMRYVRSFPQKDTTRTPLDPQVALYIFFLKAFASIFVLGSLFTVWICVLAATDTYMVNYIVNRDIHHCHRQDGNATACAAKEPFCHFVDDVVCQPVPLRGLYDLSAQNISPRSWRLWVVGIFEIFFCVVFVGIMLFFLQRVDTYIAGVMRLQMEYALGHRVVVVRGLGSEEASSSKAFRDRFLTESGYFRQRRNTEQLGQENRAAADEDDEDEEDEEDVYHQCDCTGLGCLFSIVGFNYYTTRRANAIFTHEGSVQELLFPREPPDGMYGIMDKTEAAMEALQEAVADQKAHQRKMERKRQKKSSSSVSSNGAGGDAEVEVEEAENSVLMMRAPFPSCCRKVPKVDYCKEVFIVQAGQLNECIDQVHETQKKGTAFVVFSSPLAAYEFVNLFESRYGLSSNRRATIAGPPGQIIQVNVTANRFVGWIRTLVVIIAFILLVFTWSIPIGFLGSLDRIAQIPEIGDTFKKYYATVPDSVRGIITAFLPVLLLGIFNICLPFMMRGFVIAMGAVNETECHGGTLHLQYVFMVLTAVIFQAALQGGLSQLADIITEPTSESVVNFFVAIVSPQGGYWYAKIATAACLSAWIDLIDPVPLLMVLLKRKLVSVQRVYDGLFTPCEFLWPRRYSFDLTILAMGLLFHMTVPLLSLLAGLYFVVRYMTQRCQLYDRYSPSLEPAGDCTNFAATAQVIRAVSWLYCLAGIGGVLLMSLRDHVGGVLCCSITLAAGILLMAHVHIISRRWVASLAHARRFFGAQRAAAYGTATPNAAPQTAREDAGHGRTRALERPWMTAAEETLAETNNTTHVFSDAGREGSPELMSPKTPVTLLLPQRTNAESHYQQQHQRLVYIHIAQEIERLERTEFHVERYWDTSFRTHRSPAMFPPHAQVHCADTVTEVV